MPLAGRYTHFDTLQNPRSEQNLDQNHYGRTYSIPNNMVRENSTRMDRFNTGKFQNATPNRSDRISTISDSPIGGNFEMNPNQPFYEAPDLVPAYASNNK